MKRPSIKALIREIVRLAKVTPRPAKRTPKLHGKEVTGR